MVKISPVTLAENTLTIGNCAVTQPKFDDHHSFGTLACEKNWNIAITISAC